MNPSCHPAAQAYIEGSYAEFFIIKHRGITGDKWAKMSKMPETANLKFHAKVIWIPGSRGVVSLEFKQNPVYCRSRCLARGVFINWDLSGFLSDWKQKEREVLHRMVFPACAYCILLFPVLKIPAVMLNHGGQGEPESYAGSGSQIWEAVGLCLPLDGLDAFAWIICLVGSPASKFVYKDMKLLPHVVVVVTLEGQS